MSQSLSSVLLHVIYSTHNRTPWLKDSLCQEMHAFLAGAVRKCGCEAYRVGGVSDHVHLAVRLHRTIAIADLIKEVKSSSSKWIKTRDPICRDFAWQKGYGVFSLGMSQRDQLIRYIEGQEAHHKTLTFQEEYRTFLNKYEITYDERYVWD
jgi:REP element-mobilizing transposase RayT